MDPPKEASPKNASDPPGPVAKPRQPPMGAVGGLGSLQPGREGGGSGGGGGSWVQAVAVRASEAAAGPAVSGMEAAGEAARKLQVMEGVSAGSRMSAEPEAEEQNGSEPEAGSEGTRGRAASWSSGVSWGHASLHCAAAEPRLAEAVAELGDTWRAQEVWSSQATSWISSAVGELWLRCKRMNEVERG